MNRNALSTILALGLTLVASAAAAQTPLQINGAWHCGNDYCTWGAVRDLVEFDQQNHWLIDRGDGVPSVNLVVLAFVNPWKLLNQTTDAQTLNGIQRGMNQDLVNYFKSNGVRVSLSMGGITYVDDWNNALAADPVQLAVNAAAVAEDLGVGIEIDYEENRSPDLAGLQTFIDTYRSLIPYDATGTNHAARLTIDLAAGDRWLIALTEKATSDWLTTSNPVLDYANAMVTARPYRKVTDATDNWQEHVDGKPQYDPPIPPLAPAKLTGSLWLTSNKVLDSCADFYYSMQYDTGDFVQNVLPNGAGVTPGMLGYMFWAAECQGTRSLCTTPYDNNTCEGGMGVASSFYSIPVPMSPLRQE